MGTVWHYEDKDGNRKEEALNDKQAADDALLVVQFQRLEALVADGKDANADSVAVESVYALADGLPTHRKAHQLAEFKRIGLKKPVAAKA